MSFCRLRGRRRLRGSRNRNLEDRNGLRLNISVGGSRSGGKRLHRQNYADLNRRSHTFARAAVNCDWRHELAKEYLLRHAEEERTHWRWVLDDLSKRRVTPVRICATSRLIILLKRSLGCSTTLRRNDPLLG
jgi:hypothetical protein